MISCGRTHSGRGDGLGPDRVSEVIDATIFNFNGLTFQSVSARLLLIKIAWTTVLYGKTSPV